MQTMSSSKQLSDFGNEASKYIRRNEHKFVELDSLNVFIGSWNVNAKLEDTENIPSWLNVSAFIGKSPDIIVIGLQEMIELSATNTIVGSSVANLSSERAARWLDQISACIRQGCMDTGERADMMSYKIIDSLSMVGIWCCIYAKKTLVPSIKNVQTKSIARGAGGLLGNKGAVCVRMDINHTSVCFVCAHLSAHREDVSKRNDDFHNITGKKVFSEPSQAYMEQLGSESVVNARLSKLSCSISEKRGELKEAFPQAIGLPASSDIFLKAVSSHDLVFFFGDLNYRIMLGVDTDEVFELLARNPNETALSDRNITLLAMDQLNIERADGRAFSNYLEGKIDFKPTYKYIAGTDIIDNRPEGKIRCPGWCDRILWKLNRPPHYQPCVAPSTSTAPVDIEGAKVPPVIAGEDGIQWARRTSALTESDPDKGVAEKTVLHFYGRAENSISDHKPIKAFFTIFTKKVDGAVRENVLLSALPHWEQTVSDPASEPVPGSYFVDMHPSYVLEKNVPYNLLFTSKMSSSSNVAIPIRLLRSSLPSWIDLLSPSSSCIRSSASVLAYNTTDGGCVDEGDGAGAEYVKYSVDALTPLRIAFRVNYAKAMAYVMETTGKVQGTGTSDTSRSDDLCVELSAVLTFVFQEGHELHHCQDCVTVPLSISFLWYDNLTLLSDAAVVL